MPKGLSSHRTAAIHTTLARGVEATPAEIGDFETGIEKRVHADVVDSVVHGPGTEGALVVNVSLTKLESWEGGSLVDAAAQKGIGRFVVKASDSETVPNVFASKTNTPIPFARRQLNPTTPPGRMRARAISSCGRAISTART
jgi:hypothetical protein